MAGPLPSIKFIKGNSKYPIVPGICIIEDRYKFYINMEERNLLNMKSLSIKENIVLSARASLMSNQSTKCVSFVINLFMLITRKSA
jgi:hypothetical protein